MMQLEEKAEKRYVYDHPKKDYIRLLLLDINGENDPLCGKLLTAYRPWPEDSREFFNYMMTFEYGNGEVSMKKLTGSEDYVALSYRWVTTNPSQPVKLHLTSVKNAEYDEEEVEACENLIDYEPQRNGYITITEHLQDYLMMLRTRKWQKFLWIDAICIDQNNSHDINNALPSMKCIYDEASSLHVWFGVANPEELLAVRLLSHITSKLQEKKPRTQKIDQWLIDSSDLPLASHPFWSGIAAIFQKEWWNRIWTLQEIALIKDDRSSRTRNDSRTSPKAHVYIGSDTFHWELLEQFAASISKHNMQHWLMSFNGYSTMYQLYGLDALREINTCRESRSFHFHISATLVSSRRRVATHDRDMIRGILGLLDTSVTLALGPIHVNVNANAEDIYVIFAKYYITNVPHECLLNHVESGNRLLSLPSWCPDFSRPRKMVSIGTRWTGRYENLESHEKQLPHAGYVPRSPIDLSFSRSKWSIPQKRAWVIRHLGNILRGIHAEHNHYNTNHPYQISLVPDSDCIIANGIYLDTVTHVIDCNPAADSDDFFEFHGIYQTYLWEQDCRKLAESHINSHTDWIDIFARTIIANRVCRDVFLESDIVYDNESKTDISQGYQSFRQHIRLCIEHGSVQEFPSEALRYGECLAAMSRRRRFYVTQCGRIGLGPAETEAGDEVVVILFCPTPYLIRTHEEEPYQFIGESYVHGVMYGEVLDWVDRGQAKVTRWTIG